MGVKKITLSPEDYENLPRKEKRALKRSLESQGLEMPKIEPRTMINETVDKELYFKGIEILQRNQLSVGDFLDIAFSNLIKADD